VQGPQRTNGMFRRFRLWSGILVLTCLCQAAAQPIEYFKVPPPVLDERLHRVTDKTSDREQALHELFESVGCKESSLDEQPVKHARTPNIVCTLAGTDERRIVVGAHYDKVLLGHGASLLHSLFEGLHKKARRLTFVFIGFTDEEQGLVGSRYYVSHLTKEDKTKILAMVNIDSLGLSATKIWMTRADKQLANAAEAVAHATNLPLGAVNVDRVGDSDSAPFLNARIPVIDFHSVTQETFGILHTSQDAFPALKMKEYVDSCNLLEAYLAYLDATLGASPPAP
jgi:hypothetical protein